MADKKTEGTKEKKTTPNKEEKQTQEDKQKLEIFEDYGEDDTISINSQIANFEKSADAIMSNVTNNTNSKINNTPINTKIYNTNNFTTLILGEEQPPLVEHTSKQTVQEDTFNNVTTRINGTSYNAAVSKTPEFDEELPDPPNITKKQYIEWHNYITEQSNIIKNGSLTHGKIGCFIFTSKGINDFINYIAALVLAEYGTYNNISLKLGKPIRATAYPSVAILQAINESGWGKTKNKALFGQSLGSSKSYPDIYYKIGVHKKGDKNVFTYTKTDYEAVQNYVRMLNRWNHFTNATIKANAKKNNIKDTTLRRIILMNNHTYDSNGGKVTNDIIPTESYTNNVAIKQHGRIKQIKVFDHYTSFKQIDDFIKEYTSYKHIKSLKGLGKITTDKVMCSEDYEIIKDGKNIKKEDIKNIKGK